MYATVATKKKDEEKRLQTRMTFGQFLRWHVKIVLNHLIFVDPVVKIDVTYYMPAIHQGPHYKKILRFLLRLSQVRSQVYLSSRLTISYDLYYDYHK